MRASLRKDQDFARNGETRSQMDRNYPFPHSPFTTLHRVDVYAKYDPEQVGIIRQNGGQAQFYAVLVTSARGGGYKTEGWYIQRRISGRTNRVLRTTRGSANMAQHLRSGVARVHATARRAERGCTYERGDGASTGRGRTALNSQVYVYNLNYKFDRVTEA